MTYQTQGADLGGQGRRSADLAAGAPQVHWEKEELAPLRSGPEEQPSSRLYWQHRDPERGLDRHPSSLGRGQRRAPAADTTSGGAERPGASLTLRHAGCKAAKGRPLLPPHLHMGKLRPRPGERPVRATQRQKARETSTGKARGAQGRGEKEGAFAAPAAARARTNFDFIGVELGRHGGGGWCRMNPDSGRPKRVAP